MEMAFDSKMSSIVLPIRDEVATALDASQVTDKGLPQVQEELDDLDPAALLESLANFETSTSHNNLAISNDHIASLLKAAATADQHEPLQQDGERIRGRVEQAAAQHEDFTKSQQNKKRSNEYQDSGTGGFLLTKVKRKKASDLCVNGKRLSGREEEEWASAHGRDDHSHFDSSYEHDSFDPSEMNSLDAGSAAVLFRQPSAAAKKYTRKPIAEIFTSLQITTKAWVELQSAAKEYMLDPEHPEREKCVSKRGDAETAMAKLKLFESTKYFLEDVGWGEKCWGYNTQSAQVRGLVWPDKSDKIITLVMELLRRLVGNERQRRYISEKRAAEKAAKKSTSSPAAKTRRKTRQKQGGSISPRTHTSPGQSDQEHSSLDPQLDQYHYNIALPFDVASGTQGQVQNLVQTQVQNLTTDNVRSSSTTNVGEPSEIVTSGISYKVNIIRDGRRVWKQPILLDPTNCPGFPSLIQYIHMLKDEGAKIDGIQVQIDSVQVLAPDGLKHVESQEDWLSVLKLITDCEWMDGDVKIVANVTSQA